MVRVLALLASLALVMAAAIPRQQLPLIVHDAGCNGYDASAVDPKAQTFGFVNLVRNGADELIAEVVLRGAKPFSTYGVRLIQVDGDVALNCQYGDFNNRFTFFLTTDGSGNGAANVQEVASSQATTAWVDLNRDDKQSRFLQHSSSEDCLRVTTVLSRPTPSKVCFDIDRGGRERLTAIEA